VKSALKVSAASLRKIRHFKPATTVHILIFLLQHNSIIYLNTTAGFLNTNFTDNLKIGINSEEFR